jgi:catechol 2,3-dioxygenase-like lactoylglutathione lyase family enzyme
MVGLAQGGSCQKKGVVGAVSSPRVSGVLAFTSGDQSHGLKHPCYDGLVNKGVWVMQQQISVITLGIANLIQSRRFYAEGFGWTPVFENEEIACYQMNGFVFGTWQTNALEGDMARRGLLRPGAFSLAHNVSAKDDVAPLMERLKAAGGRILRSADAPPHGGFRGYVADPDDHAWEIAWNPSWPINDQGHVTFGL